MSNQQNPLFLHVLSLENFMDKHEVAASTSSSAGRSPILQTQGLLFLEAVAARDARVRVTKIFWSYFRLYNYHLFFETENMKFFFIGVVVCLEIAGFFAYSKLWSLSFQIIK